MWSANYRYVLLYNGSLVIDRVQAEDAAVYKCVGYTSLGPVQTFAVQLSLACTFVSTYYTGYRRNGVTSHRQPPPRGGAGAQNGKGCPK